MPFTVTFELPEEQEAKLRAAIRLRDPQSVREVLQDVLQSIAQELLAAPERRLSDVDFRSISRQLIEQFSGSIPAGTPELSDYAVSREGIYQDHP